MDDLIVNRETRNMKGKTVLLNKFVQLFCTDSQFEEKTIQFLKWLSDVYLPQVIVFLPEVSSNIRDAFLPQECVYGIEPSLIETNHSLIKFIRKATLIEDDYYVGLGPDMDGELGVEKASKNAVKSYFILPIHVRKKRLGYIGFFEDEVSRLWSDDERTEVQSIIRVFSQYFYSETLEMELFSKEDILQKAVESSNDGYWHIDLKQNQMHFSRQWKRMLGYEESEVADSFQTFEEMLHPDDRDLVLKVLDPYMKIGVGTYECEYRIRNKKGDYLWVLTRANVNFSENGIPLQFVATNTDITSRIEYKNQLAKSEAKFKRLIGSIHEIIFELDSNGLITFLNEAWERHLLLKVDKSIGTEAVKYIHPEDRGIAYKLLGTPYNETEYEYLTEELRLIAANGKSLWMEIHVSIRFNDQKMLSEIKGTLINIDERKRVEIAKKFDENRLTRISENINDLIVEIDEQGKYLFISDAVQNMVGRSPSEFIGKNASDDIHPKDRRRAFKIIFQKLIRGDKRVVDKYRIKNASGDYIWVETVMQPLISASGKRTFIGATRDISARMEVEREMKKALQKEKDLNELKSRFITMTSHEFRTPLSNIQSSVGLLEMYAEDLGDRFMKPFEKHFGKITSQVRRINNLLNNIDTLGKIESSQMPYHPIKQNLEEFVTNLINNQIKEEFQERVVRLKVKGTPSPQLFDPSLFDTLLSNVIKNALLYSTDEEVNCTLSFADEGFEVVVSDKGLGIPNEEMQHLFTSFFRAKNIVNLNIPGNGLGLVISKKIVDLHGGQIKIESEENMGTTITINFPSPKLEETSRPMIL